MQKYDRCCFWGQDDFIRTVDFLDEAGKEIKSVTLDKAMTSEELTKEVLDKLFEQGK